MKDMKDIECYRGESDFAIKVEHVSKKYCKSIKRSMLYGAKDIGRNTLGLSSHSEKLRESEFWAVDNIAFELKKGGSLGIIGPNGSGKTTLLKMINGIFWPDKGKITIRGRVGALIEVGAGFHPLLTGRENIYLNAAILGMTKKEVEGKFDEIVKFADIGDFLDTPVKFYSSGMFVRLGFSVAVYCEPDILLVDEILAVGDASFRIKCYNVLSKFAKEKTVIFVSHDSTAVSRLCSNCLLLNKGKALFYGETNSALSKYALLRFEKDGAKFKGEITQGGNTIYHFTVKNKANIPIKRIEVGEPVVIEFSHKIRSNSSGMVFFIHFCSSDGIRIAHCASNFNGHPVEILPEGKVKVSIPDLRLKPGTYYIGLMVLDADFITHYLICENISTITVVGSEITSSYVSLSAEWEFSQAVR